MKIAKHSAFQARKAVRILLLVLLDIVLINLSQFLALFLRFEFNMSSMLESNFLHNILVFSPVNTAMVILVMAFFGVYNSLWEYVSIKEAGLIAASVVICSILQYFGMSMLNLAVPRSFPLIHTMLLSGFIIGERLLYRLL